MIEQWSVAVRDRWAGDERVQITPLTMCDECHMQIADADMGMVLHTAGTGPVLLHKGTCDDFWAFRHPDGERYGWDELTVWLTQLVVNAGMVPPISGNEGDRWWERESSPRVLVQRYPPLTEGESEP